MAIGASTTQENNGWKNESSGRISAFSIVFGARVAPLARCVTLAPGRSAAGPNEWLTVAKNTVWPRLTHLSRNRGPVQGASETVRESDLFVRTMRLTHFLFRFAPCQNTAGPASLEGLFSGESLARPWRRLRFFTLPSYYCVREYWNSRLFEFSVYYPRIRGYLKFDYKKPKENIFR